MDKKFYFAITGCTYKRGDRAPAVEKIKKIGGVYQKEVNYRTNSLIVGTSYCSADTDSKKSKNSGRLKGYAMSVPDRILR